MSQAVRWGICSTGLICHDFVSSLTSLPITQHQVTAVASRNKNRADEFALSHPVRYDFVHISSPVSSHHIPNSLGSYQELAESNQVDVVYVGSVNNTHFDICKLMLENGKHVLCEKPLGVNPGEVKELFSIAKNNNKFLMEGAWSRHFPAWRKVAELLANNTIGEVVHVSASFGAVFAATDHWTSKKEFAGGSLHSLGHYPISLAQFVFSNESPLKQTTQGSLNENGVDTTSNMILEYSKGRSAVLSSSTDTFMSPQASIHGKKGVIKIGPLFWCPTSVEVLNNKFDKVEEFNYPLPQLTEGIKCNFWNGPGMAYEAEEARRCIAEGLLESPNINRDASVSISEIMTQARKQLGYHLPQDK